MKRITLTICTVLILFACNNDKKTEETKTDKDTTKTEASVPKQEVPPKMDSAAMMKAMMDYGTPGEMHKMLAKSDGNWTEDITFWMDPSAPAQKMTASCTNKMVLNGLYQQSVHTGSFNKMPFEGHSTVGYDNAKKVFFSSWIDNMGSGIQNLEGTWDDATKTLTMKGKETDPMSGKDMDVRETMTMNDDNNQKIEMFKPGPDGKEYKCMEIALKRKK
jgi:hypothetical protein